MNDYTILENLFKDEQDEIHFDFSFVKSVH